MCKNLMLGALAVAIGALGASADDKAANDSTGFKFTDVKVIKTTPVKDQNSSGTCWCFSGNSFMEEEIMRKGGPEVDLSEMYVVRQCYLDKAMKFMRTYGVVPVTQGGSVLDVGYVWDNYGAVPEEVYSGLNYGEEKHVHGELEKAIQAYLGAIVKKPNRKLSTAWYKGLEGILDAYLGEVPETFTYNGKTYTPRSFADAMGLDQSDYVALTSFSHHPYYRPFAMEVADNWLWGSYMNLPMEDLKAVVDNAIDNGYTVAWAADVSEPGFKWKEGYAVMPKAKTEADMSDTELARWVKLSDSDRRKEQYDIKGPVEEITVTPEMRQEMFDRQETTDDHGMVIVGKAVDQKGNRYYKVKNSWDTNQVFDGFFYVSEPYFLAKTMSLLVNRNSIPKNIASKMK